MKQLQKRRTSNRRSDDRNGRLLLILAFGFVLALEHNYDLIARVGLSLQSIAWAVFHNDEKIPLRP